MGLIPIFLIVAVAAFMPLSIKYEPQNTTSQTG